MIEPITEESQLIYDFSEEKFFELVQSNQIFVDVTSKTQVGYLYRYLKKLNCQTIVCEEKYIDKYFLDDYIHFYGTCYQPSSRTCRRLHFFKSRVTIDEILSGKSITRSSLQRNYLGFAIIKPIPNLVGRTLIKVFEDTNCTPQFGFQANCRHILTLRKYNSNLFGNALTIESLPFQEQDQIISACATSALWTILDKTAYEFDYYIPTPFEITRAANKSFSMNRPLPSSGLNLIQITNAVKEFGMEAEVLDLKHNELKQEYLIINAVKA